MRAGSIQIRLLGILAVGVVCSFIACSGGGGGASSSTSSQVTAEQVVISFPQTELSIVQGTALNPPLVPNVTGSATSFSGSPGLPEGLTLDSATGAIAGTPLKPADPTDYVISATTPGGSVSTTLRITVLPAAPAGLAYLQPTLAATVGVAIAADTPTVAGSALTFTVDPPLPAGLALDPGTGAVTGTPTTVAASAPYVVTATNATGSTTATLTVAVAAELLPPMDLTYPQTSLTAVAGKAVPEDLPTVSGTVTSYAVAPALPAGLSLSAATGAISGTPTLPSAQTVYTVTAANAAGTAIALVTLTVEAAAPTGLTYPVTTLTGTVGLAITPDTPTATGTVTSFSVAPALPAGLSLDAATGTLSGTPTAASASAAYTVTALNGTGSTTATLTLSVDAELQPPSSLAYPVTTLAATVGQAIASDTPTVTGSVTSYAVSPALPAGLTLNETTGAISGTPTAAASSATYTITASNAAGSDTAALTLGVSALLLAPASLTYAQPTLAATVGQAISVDTPTVTGTATSFTVTPALPAGLSLNATTGTLSGTPTAAFPATTYTVTATNAAGSTQTTLTLSAIVPLAAPSGFSYPVTALTATVGTAIASDAPTVTGTVEAYAVSPALPAGLALNAATGALTGTATAAAAAATYTITASNAAGSAEAEVVITCSPAAATGKGGLPGFMAILQNFPSSALFASAKTAAAMAANPWMLGTRFFVGTENLCQDTTLPAADWNYDESNVSGFTNPMTEVMIRMSGDPDAAWNVQDVSAATNEDAVVTGVVAVANAAHTASFMLDPENYSTTYLLHNFNQTSGGSPILNSPSVARTTMCASLRAFGKAVGTSLWSRVPDARLYLTFGSTYILQYTDGGTGIPASFPDASYADNAYYNMLPYFCLGLLDACPSTGRIIDYSEAGYYTFTGQASLTRIMTSSQNWVSIFFPTETADIAKSATCWVPVPLIFINPYFNAAYGAGYPGASYVTNTTDQAAFFTRNALYCLQQTPAGFMPGLYVETYDPWGLTGTVSNMPAAWQTCLANAISVYQGNLTLGSLFDEATLDTDLAADFKGNPAWVAESQ